MYYMWANIAQLNAFRRMKGLEIYQFRPHAGADDKGSSSHLSSAFLVADSINHGIKLQNSKALQYLYYLNQIGVVLSPLAEDSLYVDYSSNPFNTFFERGLRVTLSSDNPMQTHTTDNPLLEEYSIASKMWKLSSTDLSEIARNSVLISGFSDREKKSWLGSQCLLPGVRGNDPSRSNLPQLRIYLRQSVLQNEMTWLSRLDQVYEKAVKDAQLGLVELDLGFAKQITQSSEAAPQEESVGSTGGGEDSVPDTLAVFGPAIAAAAISSVLTFLATRAMGSR
jgi:AMP deaminase